MNVNFRRNTTRLSPNCFRLRPKFPRKPANCSPNWNDFETLSKKKRKPNQRKVKRAFLENSVIGKTVNNFPAIRMRAHQPTNTTKVTLLLFSVQPACVFFPAFPIIYVLIHHYKGAHSLQQVSHLLLVFANRFALISSRALRCNDGWCPFFSLARRSD